MWEPSFVAVTVLAGGSVDDAVAALPQESVARFEPLLSRLRAPARTTRATALAEIARDVALAIEQGALR
jgi:hypothetical protein